MGNNEWTFTLSTPFISVNTFSGRTVRSRSFIDCSQHSEKAPETWSVWCTYTVFWDRNTPEDVPKLLPHRTFFSWFPPSLKVWDLPQGNAQCLQVTFQTILATSSSVENVPQESGRGKAKTSVEKGPQQQCSRNHNSPKRQLAWLDLLVKQKISIHIWH